MADCERWGEALERKLRGAQPEEEARELAGHLEGCADCRGYLEVAARMELELHAELAPARPDEQRLRLKVLQGIDTDQRTARGMMLLGGMMLAVGAEAVSQLMAHPGDDD